MLAVAQFSDRATVLRAIAEAAPPTLGDVSDNVRCRLEELTAALLRVSPESQTEFRRYLAVSEREISLFSDLLFDRLNGRRILVTGGSGCIGTALLRQVARFKPKRIVSVDIAPPPPTSDPSCGVEHLRVDIRDLSSLAEVFKGASPDVVFHLAAQRNPGLAELEVHRTISTNIFGTRNVVKACALASVGELVVASTGKALRPYMTKVYAASKRAAEFIVADAVTSGAVAASVVRFTHVVDNAIVIDRFRTWCRRREIMRVHSIDSMFYAQSARESAQLLLAAFLGKSANGMGIFAIRDLGWPISVIDLALGVMAEEGLTPLQITGHDPGYEEQAYPGLYNPANCGDVSPLLNGLEAPASERFELTPDVDMLRYRGRLPTSSQRQLVKLEECCARDADPATLRAELDALCKELLEITLSKAEPSTLKVLVALAERYPHQLSAENTWMHERFRWWAARQDR
jgi:nucleoside-diphosphate-sugar epimerase